MSQPPRIEDQNSKLIYILHKSLYGLKQAPLAWFEHHTFLQLGFYSTQCDFSWFIKHISNVTTFELENVDDIILTRNDSSTVTALIQ